MLQLGPFLLAQSILIAVSHVRKRKFWSNINGFVYEWGNMWSWVYGQVAMVPDSYV